MLSAALALLLCTNAARAVHHLPRLRSDTRLNVAARLCAEPGVLACVRRLGFATWGAGENRARGAITPCEAVRLWLRSPPHRANVLGHWRVIGTAVIPLAHDPLFVEVFSK